MNNRKLRSDRPLFHVATTTLAAATVLGAITAVAQDAPPPDKGWETSASAGLTITRGNSKNFLATAGLETKRKWAQDEVFLGTSAGYGKATVRSDTAADE